MGFKMTYNRIRFYSSFLLLGFYWVIGILFLFTNVWADLLPQGRPIVGSVLIAFGSLRFYIGYRRYINKIVAIKTKEQKQKDVVAE